MAYFPGGAGGLSSYMNSGGGGEGGTSKASGGSGGGQIILLLMAACAIPILLTFAKFDTGSSSNNKSAYNSNGSNSSQNGSGSNGSGSGSSSGVVTDSDSEEGSKKYNSLDDLDFDALLENLDGAKVWKTVDDAYLVLKVLENKTFENSVEDDFVVDVTKIGDLETGMAEYLVTITKKENVEGGEVFITSIKSKGVSDNDYTIHDVANTNSKKFTIVASNNLSTVLIGTNTGKIVSSGGITIKNITTNIKTGEIKYSVESKNGINKVEFLDENNNIISTYTPGNTTTIRNVFSKDTLKKIKTIRVMDTNGFVAEGPVKSDV